MKGKSIVFGVWIAGSCAFGQVSATFNGNDLALYYSEARTQRERVEVLQSAGRRAHYFRYLQIMEMEEQHDGRRRSVHIVAQEPASGMDIAFVVNRPVSLRVLDEEPESRRGRAIAISGIVSHVDDETGTMVMEQAIVRHKDRLAPLLLGREMLHEIDDRAIFYSFSGGRETIQLSYRDRDLLQHRSILTEQGDQAWADFLASEIAKRREQREQEARERVERQRQEREQARQEQDEAERQADLEE